MKVSGRIAAFGALAVALATANTYGSTLAASLFLSRAGAESIPLYYMLYAALSIPVSVAFTHLIDRWPRPLFFGGLLVGGAVAMAAVAPLAGTENMALFFALYIIISVFEQLSYSVYYVLMADYFTSVETNRSATTIAVGMAGGGLLGGGLAGVAADMYSMTALLYAMPAMLAGTLGFFLVMKARVRPLGDTAPQAEEGLLDSLKAFRPLMGRYPIVTLIALGVFLNILVQSVIEYQVFSIYTEKYPDEQELTAFLGYLNGVLNLFNIVTSYLITAPLMNRLGAARMNVVYPAMTVGAFAALGGSYSLPSAVFAHVVYDPWAHSVDAPVFVSNYNAVPHRFVGRVRVLNDGLVYPLAMAAAGGMLLVVQDVLTPFEITLIGGALAAAFLLCGVGIRRAYTHGLMEMLKAGSLDLDRADGSLGKVSKEHHAEIRRLLESNDHHQQVLGLELAARADAQDFSREIEDLLGRAVAPVRATFVRRFANQLTPEIGNSVSGLLEAEDAAVRGHALEALVAAAQDIPAGRLRALVADPAPQVAGIAAVAALRLGADIEGAAAALDRMVNGSERLQLRLLQVVRNSRDPALAPLLLRLRAADSPSVRTALLDTVADCFPRHGAFAGWAEADIAHGDSRVRRAAYRLMAETDDPAVAPRLAQGLGDDTKDVRLMAASGLGTLGPAALGAAQKYLEKLDARVEEAAIEAVGRIGGQEADDVLYRHLVSRHFAAVWRNMRWLDVIPLHDPAWAAFAAALIDGNRRALDAALHTLSALGYRRTLNTVRGILAAGDQRSRANAIETVASLNHRRYVRPLLPLLEHGVVLPERKGKDSGGGEELAALLHTALNDDDRWLRTGALMAAVQSDLNKDYALKICTRDNDPVLRDNYAALQAAPTGELPMNRLLFLKSVPLFAGLSLDDILSVDSVLGQEDYIDGEAIMTQGEAGATLYVLLKGEAAVELNAGGGTREIARLKPSEFFGEMALFDDQPRSATVKAVGDCVVLTLERDRFSTLVTQRPEVLLHMCKMFGNRLREANRKLMEIWSSDSQGGRSDGVNTPLQVG